MLPNRPTRTNAFVILCASILLACGLASASPPERLTLVEAGKARAEIVVAKSASPGARWAAHELQRVLEKSTGAKMPIVAAAGSAPVAIHVGPSNAAKRLGIDPARIGLERMRIVARAEGDGGALCILGRDDPQMDPERDLSKKSIWATYYERGTIFAVYEFLERIVGARWFWPGESGEVIPTHTTLTVPQMDLDVRPYFSERLMGLAMTPEQKLWMLRLRRSSWHRPNMHSLHRLGLVKRFGKTHPEYFALKPDGSHDVTPRGKHWGHLTFTAPGLAEEIAKDAVSYFRGEPPTVRGVLNRYNNQVWDPNAAYGKWFNLMQHDGFYRSLAPGDKKWWSQGPQGETELLWQFFTKVMRLAEKEVDNAHWTCSAYGPAKLVPQTVEIPENVHVRCCFGSPNDIALGTFDNTKELIVAWNKKLGRRVGNSFYMLMKREGVPGFAFDYVGQYYAQLKDYLDGCHGYLESVSANFSSHINLYMMARMAMDADRDPDEIMNEFYAMAFGPAAEPIRAFYEEMQDLWMKEMVTNVVDTPLGPVTQRPSVPDMWREVFTADVIARNARRFDEAEKLAASDPQALERVRVIRARIFDAMRLERAKFAEGLEQAASIAIHAPLASSPVAIDGNVEEDAWKEAEIHRMGLNVKDREPTAPTEIRVLRTDKAILVSFVCHEKDPTRIVRTPPRPDKKRYAETSVELFIGPTGDPDRNVYQLIVDTYGTFSGYHHTKNEKTRKVWEPNAKAAATIGKDRWTCEIELPLASLGEHGKAKELIFNACRNRYLSGDKGLIENCTWSPMIVGHFLQPWAFGRLRLVDRLPDPDAGNLLSNGSFDDASGQGHPRGWGRLGNGMALDREHARFGPYCLKIEGAATERRHTHRVLTKAGLKPDTEYLLTFWARVDGVEVQPVKGKISPVSGCGINLYLDGNHWFPSPAITGTTPWKPYAWRFRTPKAPLKTAYLRLKNWWTTGAAYFDAVQLREVP